MNISPELIVTIFVLMALTIPAAIGGVFVFRGTYYKSLPARIDQLESENERKTAALQRQAAELDHWKGVATQTPEIRKLLEFYERHDTRAEGRFTKIERQHEHILRTLLRIEGKLDARDRGQT